MNFDLEVLRVDRNRTEKTTYISIALEDWPVPVLVLYEQVAFH